VPQTETRYGLMQILETDKDLISRWLSQYGEWAQHELRFVAGALSDGARVADVGSFLGTFGLGLASLRRLSGLCFVEANPAIAPLLRENVTRNSPLLAAVVEAVVAPKGFSATATMEVGNAGTFSFAAPAGEGRVAADQATEYRTLRQLDEAFGPFDLIKIDVEGMEASLLKDDLSLVRSGSTSFWLECNDSIQSLDLCDVLLSLGFDVYYYSFPAFSHDNFKNSTAVELPFAHEAGLWATRGSAPPLDSSLRDAGCRLIRIRNREELRTALWLTPRWAPEQWVDHSGGELVALAAHTLLGENYGDYLLAGTPSSDGGRVWSRPIPVILQEQIEGLRAFYETEIEGLRASYETQIENVHSQHKRENEILQEYLTDSRAYGESQAAQNRSLEIMMFYEHKRTAAIIEAAKQETQRLNDEISRSVSRIQQIYGSTSWRFSVPVRLLARLLKGQWADIGRTLRRFGF